MPKNELQAEPQVSSDPARERVNQDAVASSYTADRATVLRMLNHSLATEMVCVLRYRRHYFMARAFHSQNVAREFLEHSNEEQGHADQLAERIVELGGEPEFSPSKLASHSYAEYIEGSSLTSMIHENLVAEGIEIDTYRALIQYLDNNDPDTKRMIEGILSVEEEHADELSTVLSTLMHERLKDRYETSA